MSIATCGHEVKNPIGVTIETVDREGRDCYSYGSYCIDCTLMYYSEGVMVKDSELYQLIYKMHAERACLKKMIDEGITFQDIVETMPNEPRG